MAKRSLIRFEDLGCYPAYNNPTNQEKMRIIADYLKSEGVPFQVSVVPRAFMPVENYDKSISSVHDPDILAFNDTLRYFLDSGGTLDIEGYTHQYGLSSIGYEFSSNSCSGNNCPPNDPPEANTDLNLFVQSYASGRINGALETFRISSLDFDGFFITPGYSASTIQRHILSGWIGLFYEDDPFIYGKRTVSIYDNEMPFYRGIVYVPTPLGYVHGTQPQSSVDRMLQSIQSYGGNDLASFFYHMYLEFPFIQITQAGFTYDDNSYLKQLIRGFKQQGFTFIPVSGAVRFYPGPRSTDILPGTKYTFLTGDVNADKRTDFIAWDSSTGDWYFALSNMQDYMARGIGWFSVNKALSGWAIGSSLRPLSGDFTGNKETDVVVWNPSNGNWQVALSTSSGLKPSSSNWLNSWAVDTYWMPLVGDFNGDGKDDILVYNRFGGDWQVALSDGTKFTPQPPWLQNFAIGSGWVPLVGDFNGDGKTDIAAWNSTTGQWIVALSDGTKFVSQGTWLSNWAVGSNWKALVGDFDGDGKDDILVVDAAQGDWQVARSLGNSFQPVTIAFKPWGANVEMQPFVGHFSGNKKANICARHPNLNKGTLDVAISLIEPL